jgi:hypothetical protein
MYDIKVSMPLPITTLLYIYTHIWMKNNKAYIDLGQ